MSTGSLDFLQDGGEMGALMRQYDWSRSPLGAPDRWPDILKSAVATCLASRFPLVVWWGPELIMLYNDAWKPILGETKHPAGLGRPGAESWPETWPIVGKQFEDALKGNASWSEDLLLASDRHGFLEECYFTYSHSPLKDSNGLVVGVLTAVIETTDRVLGNRRMRTLRDLSKVTLEAASHGKSVREACAPLLRVICNRNPDVPFAAQYSIDEVRQARLICSAGIQEGLLPREASEAIDDEWGLSHVLRDKQPVVTECTGRRNHLPSFWPEPTFRLLALPLVGRGEASELLGILLIGVNARLRLDESYLDFLKLVAAEIAGSIGTLQGSEREKRDLAALSRLARSSSRLWRKRDLHGGLQEMLAGAIELLGADMGNIQLFNAERRVLEIAAHSAFNEDFLNFFREVSVEDDSACGRALRTGERVIIEDIEADPDYAQFCDVARGAGYRSVQSSPVLDRTGSPLGMLSTHFHGVHRPSPQVLRVLDLYVRQVADFIERRQSDDALLESELRFRNMADNAPVMVWVSGPDGSCTYLSKSWYELTGQTPETALGDGRLHAIHPDDREQCEREFRTAYTGRRAFRVEYRVQRADGEFRWMIDAATPRFSSDGGFLGHIGSILDIHERKLAEEREHFLMREVNHRAKNILSLVQVVARQTIATTPENFLARLDARLQALSASQDLLLKSAGRPCRFMSSSAHSCHILASLIGA